MITTQKMKFSIKDFFNKCDQIHSFLRIWSHLLKKSLMENFIFCVSLSFSLSFLCAVDNVYSYHDGDNVNDNNYNDGYKDWKCKNSLNTPYQWTHPINEEGNGSIADFPLINFVTFQGCVVAGKVELKLNSEWPLFFYGKW